MEVQKYNYYPDGCKIYFDVHEPTAWRMKGNTSLECKNGSWENENNLPICEPGNVFKT